MQRFFYKTRTLFFSLLLILTGLLASSCSIDWFGDLKNDLEKDTCSVFKFYLNETSDEYVVRYFRIGTTIDQSSFPAAELSQLIPGYKVAYFKFLGVSETADNTCPDTIQLSEDNQQVLQVFVDTKSYLFYGVVEERDDIPYVVRHMFQNLTMDGYEENTSLRQNLVGVTNHSTAAAALNVPGFFAQPFFQETIRYDGSTEVLIYYDRIQVFLTVDYNDGVTSPLNLYGYYGLPVTGVSIPDRTSEGASFSHWNISYADSTTETSTATSLTYPAQSAVYTAVWNEITYSITWVLDHGITYASPEWRSGFTPPESYTRSNPFVLPAVTDLASHEGYSFEGWYLDSAYTQEITACPTSNMSDLTIYAKWSREIYSIAYYLNGGSFDSSASPVTTYTIEDIVTLPSVSDISRNDYTFIGWYESSTFAGVSVSGWEKGTETGNKEFYARWVENSGVSPAYPEESDGDLTISSVSYTGGTLSFAATYTPSLSSTSIVVQWILDGELLSGADSLTGSQTVTLSPGYHSIVVVVTDNGEQFSADQVFQVQN